MSFGKARPYERDPDPELGPAPAADTTSLVSFFRGIGGTLGTSVPGAVLAQRLAEETAAAADSSPATAPDRKADDLVEARDLVQAGSGE